MMAYDINALAAECGGAALDVFRGAVMARHVERGRGEFLDLVAEVAGDGERFQKDFRHDHGAADIQHDTAFEVRAHGAFRMLQNPMVVNAFQLTNTKLRIKLKPDGTLEGIIGGYQPWADIYSGFASGAPGMEMCITGDIPGLYYLLKKHADASPDPKTGENMAISTAYHFEAVPAFIVDAGGKLVAGP